VWQFAISQEDCFPKAVRSSVMANLHHGALLNRPRVVESGRQLTRRRGFTLIEMLISVALVLLMMVLFAEIFGLASETMTLQQAIADGDQRVRSFTTVFRSDLQKRTFRTLVPLDSREEPSLAGVPFADRRGYLYISLNDPDDATDNFLQFTVSSSVQDENGDDTEYFGRGSGIVQRANLNGTLLNPANAAGNVRANSQQPEHDDGELANNFTASSTASEIAYFMRGGRLYRRVVLIRNPLSASGTRSAQPRLTWDSIIGDSFAEPVELLRHNVGPTASVVQTVGGQYRRFDPTSGFVLSDDYWLDFDQSAYLAFPGGAIDGANMIGLSALDNSQSDALGLTMRPTFTSAGAGAQLEGPRCRRFGFDQSTGISREFSHAFPAASGYFFLGRYTLEEMSNTRFNFPQNPAIDSSGNVVGNPMSYTDFPAATDAGLFPNGAVDDFEGGSRRGQDLLMSNVHAFEIQIWDDRLGRFTQLGHQQSIGGVKGDYHRDRNQQLQLGFVSVPGDSTAWSAGQFARRTGRVFDTWHPDADFDGDSETDDPAPAPYRPMLFYPPGSPDGPYASRGLWQPDVQYAVGDIVFPAEYISDTIDLLRQYTTDSAPKDYSFYYLCVSAGTSSVTEDVNGDGMLDLSEDLDCDGVLDPGEDTNMNGMLDLGEDTVICNRLIDTGEPVWPAINRAFVEPTPGSSEPRWLAIRNVRPLRAIRIQVRFFHESSGRMRQVSLVHSLVDEDE
jgi:prepilin-type N-terminal cleavage/methylation domain-containing protein